MKKRLLPLCLIMAAAVGLTACSGSQQGSEEVATEAAGETGQEAENGADEVEPAGDSGSSDSEKTDIRGSNFGSARRMGRSFFVRFAPALQWVGKIG